MSGTTLLHNYLPLGETQIVPEFVKFENPTRSTVIIDRMSTSYPPTSGSSYSVNGSGGTSNQISFLISDASRFMDLSSASLNFDYQLLRSGTAAGAYINTLPVDNALSLFTRVQIKIGGVLLEDILQSCQDFNAKMLSNCNKDYYDNNASVLTGSWLYNQSYGGTNIYTDDVATRFKSALIQDYSGVVAPAGGGQSSCSRSFTIPMSFLSGVFAMQKVLCLPLLNTLEVNLYLNTIADGHYSIDATPQTSVLPNLTMNLNNVRLNCDMLEMNSSYCQIIKKIAYEDHEGINLAFDTTQSFSINYNSTAGSAGQQQLSFNKASPFVRSVMCCKTNNVAQYNNLGQMSTINFLNNGNSGVRISCGSIYNPVYGLTNNNATTYSVLRNADINNVIAGGIQNNIIYSGNLATNSSSTSIDKRDGLLTGFTFGFNFDKVQNAVVSKDGLDTGSLGSALQIYLNEGGNAGFTPAVVTQTGIMNLNVFIVYTRMLQLKGGVISVSG